jgi:hypothetical protein
VHNVKARGFLPRQNPHSHRPQHALRVIARGARFDDGDGHPRSESGEKEGALDLGAGYGALVHYGAQLSAANLQGQATRPAQFPHDGACSTQRIHYPGHRTTPKRRIAVERRADRASRDQPEQQTGRGTAVATVDAPVRGPQLYRPGKLEGHVGLWYARVRYAQRPHRCRGGAHVGTVREAGDAARSAGERRQHQRPVGDRFVAWNPDSNQVRPLTREPFR